MSDTKQSPAPNQPRHKPDAESHPTGKLPTIDRVEALNASVAELWDQMQRLDREEEALKEKAGRSLPLALLFAHKHLRLSSLLLRTLVQLRKSDELKEGKTAPPKS